MPDQIKQYTTQSYGSRIMGFGPISVVLDFLPFLGKASRLVIGLITFPVVLVLSIAAILVSIVAHNVIVLIAILATIIIAAIVVMVVAAGKKKAAPKQA